MKYDTIIIGGGLSGLACGISLARKGQKVMIAAAGQSSLHFSSGSFDLLGYDKQGNIVNNPIEAAQQLDSEHPYSKIGTALLKTRAGQAQELLNTAGIKVNGQVEKNHFRLSPIGIAKPTWLTVDNMVTLESPDQFPYKEVIIANICGFLDFPVEFLVDNLSRKGVKVTLKTFTTPELEHARENPSEMRATNIAKVLEEESNIKKVADEINQISQTQDIVILPSVLGIANPTAIMLLKQSIHAQITFAATMPPSVPGVFIQTRLRQYFQSQGGMFLKQNKVVKGDFTNHELKCIYTENLQDEPLQADNFVLATGSFFSGGINTNYNHIFESLFNLDIDGPDDRTQWTKENIFETQPYMSYGVRTDTNFNVQKNGGKINNLYAVGSILNGHNPIKSADSEGVSLLTGLQVAENILKK